MNKFKIILRISLFFLLAGCSHLIYFSVDTEKLAAEIEELRTLVAIEEFNDQLAQQAVRKYFSKHSLSPILDTKRPIVVQKDFIRLAIGNNTLIIAKCQQDEFNYYATFSILKQPSGTWEFTLLYLTQEKNCFISPQLFLEPVQNLCTI